ncbi:MAG: hypothetical protein OEV61_04020 [Chloroflexota bacterium]|jgi:hypothetical protein|nr:hypothetical protein [Chloroflexota bacterium]
MPSARPILAAIAWFGLALVISLGAAGLVTGMDTSPAGGARPELTMRGDAVVTPVLDAAEAELGVVADDMAALADQARRALASLNGSDLDTVAEAVAAGDDLVARIRARSTAVRTDLAAAPLVGTPDGAYELSQAVRDRHDRLAMAADTTVGLDAAWARLTAGALAASRLSARLGEHDEAVLRAAELGRAADYDAAAAALDDADAAISRSRTLRDGLAATVDVTVLDEWLSRSADYDAALRDLYLALGGIGSRVERDLRDAIEAERRAKDRLPPDPRGMMLIMAEIGRGGMSGAVIAIEEARGALADELELEPAP